MGARVRPEGSGPKRKEEPTRAPLMPALENPPDDPCFGCGPDHPRGLRPKFEKVEGPGRADEIRTFFTPRPEEIGWPGPFHPGLHFTVLYEGSYWTALTPGGRPMVSTGAETHEHRRLPRVGRPHVAWARLGPASGSRRTVLASTGTEEGRPCGSLETTRQPVERAEIERSGLPRPDHLLSEIPP